MISSSFSGYVKGTSDHKLTYCGKLAGSEPFIIYTDASHGNCIDTGRSTAHFVTMMAGGAIGWYSKLQTIGCTFYHWCKIYLERRLYKWERSFLNLDMVHSRLPLSRWTTKVPSVFSRILNIIVEWNTWIFAFTGLETRWTLICSLQKWTLGAGTDLVRQSAIMAASTQPGDPDDVNSCQQC